MFYIKDKEQIVLADENLEQLQNTLEFMPQYKELPILETKENEVIVDFKLMTVEEYDAQKAQQEQERIGKLKLTRGDVFKAILLAQGLQRPDLREMITRNETVPMLQKELALIDFDEALDFYRKNPLIDLMGNSLGIDKTHLDNFFIKGNNEETKSEAWKELIVEPEPTETPKEVK